MRPALRGVGVAMLVAALGIATTAGGAAAQTATVTYGVVSWNPFHWVVIAGVAKGHFERHGVKLDIPITGSAGAAVQAMISGSLHMTTGLGAGGPDPSPRPAPFARRPAQGAGEHARARGLQAPAAGPGRLRGLQPGGQGRPPLASANASSGVVLATYSAAPVRMATPTTRKATPSRVTSTT